MNFTIKQKKTDEFFYIFNEWVKETGGLFGSRNMVVGKGKGFEGVWVSFFSCEKPSTYSAS
jgi:hypothetical protein